MRRFLWRRINELNEKKTLSSSLKKMILGIVLSTVAAFMLATYVITKREQIDYGMRDSENVLRTLSSNISSEMEKYMSLSRLIMTEDRLVTFLRASTLSVDIGMINDARYGIMDILNVTEGVDTVMIFREDMIMLATRNFMYIYDHDRMDGDEWKQEIYDGFGSTVVSLNTFGIAERKDSKAVVTVGRAIYDISSQKRTGILLMNISNNVFERMLFRIRYNNICILGDDGTYIAGNKGYAQYYDDYFLSEKIKHRNIKVGGESQLLSGCQVQNLPIVILRVSPYGMEGIPFRMLYVLLFLLTVFMIIAVYVVLFIRQTITNPIYELSASMENNKKSGELKKIDVEVPYSELEMLEGDYNSMIDHVNELFDELVEKEKTLQRAELRVLQEQIKPHFLYNSIETIGYMAMDAGAEKVHDALETMGSFYRNFLSKGDREIPLSREIWIVKDYLSLQKLRYGDILEDEYHIDEETQDFVVPKLILQPLVENCIYHGIRMKGEKGKIEITSKLVDGELHLTVKDTGVGMKQEDIDKILCSKREEMDSNDSESFGLWGTIERIRYYAGRDDVVKITSEIGEFTEIEFIIPDKSALILRGE
ncbi:two-component system, sensor histidine kinase YesM [Butyrivibrio sp. INlla18]|uniref:sensor histidine kinase n=1 Tax=Butyrivibrio sp. INlla18 TaxID=1520806 RepID=UPI00088977D4|nr:sensor histidine kinase [Butyrivibrio sp. INlla18]SDA47116.1 two-component system, sensor histidine kinase YesM [Butyrivibrio sp. INlla18]